MFYAANVQKKLKLYSDSERKVSDGSQSSTDDELGLPVRCRNAGEYAYNNLIM